MERFSQTKQSVVLQAPSSVNINNFIRREKRIKRAEKARGTRWTEFILERRKSGQKGSGWSWSSIFGHVDRDNGRREKGDHGWTRDRRSTLWYAAMQSGTLYDYFARPRQGHPMARWQDLSRARSRLTRRRLLDQEPWGIPKPGSV